MLTFFGLLILATTIVGGAFTIDSLRRARTRRDEDGELEAVERRLIAAGELPDPAGPTGTMYTSASVADVEPPVDARIVELTIDPTLTTADVATAVEHVAPGVGSLVSFAAAADDTRMRTSVQLRELEAAEAEAYDEAPAQEERLYYAAFELRWQAMLTDFEVGTRAVRRVNAEHHASVGEHTCTLCMVGVQEISDEFQQIVTRVEAEHTGEIPRADLNRMLATR